MKNGNQQQNFNPMRTVKKFFLSAFVVITFLAYALHKPDTNNAVKLGLAPQSPTGTTQAESPTSTTAAPTAAAAPSSTTAPQLATAPSSTPAPTIVPPTAVPPTAVAKQSGQYQDGTYTGPEVDAIYGLVQVQAVVKNGKISNVQFLEYPNDRRTSVRINSYAVPYLQQEAVQVQSANVNLVSGATLTSEAFQMSLQGALSKAKGSL